MWSGVTQQDRHALLRDDRRGQHSTTTPQQAATDGPWLFVQASATLKRRIEGTRMLLVKAHIETLRRLH